MATIDIFNLSPRDFNLQMQEEAMYRTPAELDELRREYRNRNSMAGKLMGLLAPEEGKRRSTFLPVDAPQGMSIFDALRSGQATPAVPQGLVDLITGGTRGVESAREYAQGVPPRADALNDALAMSGLAMTGGGVVGVPRGAVGANAVRNIKDKYPDVEIDIYGDADRGYELGRIQVPKDQQSSGIGSQVMNDLIAAADAEGAKISLTPDTSFGGTSVSRLKDFYKRFGFVENKGRNKDFSTRNTMYRDPTAMANASKSAGLLTTAASEAQDMAKRILDLRAEGRASEVTDEMMAQADPQYMFANTPLPMDEASRMARAEAAGFKGDLFHGGKGGYDIMRTDAGTGKTSGTGAFLTPSNKLAETYSPVVDGSVYPLMSRSSAPIVNADMQNWNNIESPVYAFDPKTMDDIEVIDEYGRASTDDIAREARKISEAIEIQDVSDRGPRAWGMTQYPAVSNVRVEYNPANIRSRFARFDPEFAHLSNLSAANASPIGGLLAQSGVSDKQAERIEEYLRRRGLLD